MYDTIHDGICHDRVADCITPIVRRQLRGDSPFFKTFDLKQITLIVASILGLHLSLHLSLHGAGNPMRLGYKKEGYFSVTL